MVLTAMIALGHWDEFRLHVARGVQQRPDEADIKEVILQAAIYCGVPAANHAFKEAAAVIAERKAASAKAMSARRSTGWPEAPREGWLETAATLQMWSQIVGKVRLARAPMRKPLVAGRALSDRARPDDVADPRRKRARFRSTSIFIDHRLVIATSDGLREDDAARLPAARRILRRVHGAARSARDRRHDLAGAGRGRRGHALHRRHAPSPNIGRRSPSGFWRSFSIADMALKRFRGGFLGKSSPVASLLGRLRPRHDALLRPPRRPSIRAASRTSPIG